MVYLKNGGDGFVIPADYDQVFRNKFMINIGKNEIVKMRMNDVLQDRDIEIARFLFRFNFATAKQISRQVSLQKGADTQDLRGRLDRLVEHRVLNKFALKRFDDGEFPKEADALIIYCLDLGGRYLLANYSNEDVTDWYSIVNMKSSELISNSIATTEFYLRLKETTGKRLLHFQPTPELRVGRKVVTPSFEFSLKDGLQIRYFIGEVVRAYDFPINFRDKAEKLEELLLTNAWRKYYFESDSEPVLFVIGDSDATANRAGRLVSQTTEVQRVRYTTDERIQRELSDVGAFAKYVPSSELLQEIKAKMFD